VLVPQITGGDCPPGDVTVKVSVRHWVAWEEATPFVVMLPARVAVVEVVMVLGPAMTNILKSRRS